MNTEQPTEARQYERVGICPTCKGSGFANSGAVNERGVIHQTTCSTCNGAGQKQPKPLGEIIKEYQDG